MRNGGATPIVQPSGVLSFLDFVDPAAVLQYIDVAFDVTFDGANRISQWDDLSGAGLHYTQAAGPSQLLYSAVGGPNGTPLVSLDSAARFMASALNTPVRSITPTTMWWVMRQVTWVNGRRILDSTDVNKKTIYQEGVTPQVDMFDGGSVGNNAGGTLGSFARCIADWTVLPAGCRLHIGASNVTGINPGVGTANVGRELGKSGGLSAIVDLLVVVYMNRALLPAEETALDTVFIPGRWGVGNVLV